MPEVVRTALSASLVAEGKNLSSRWMVHQRRASQAAKKAKEVESKRPSRTTARTRGSGRSRDIIELSATPSPPPRGFSSVSALRDIATAIRENTAEMSRVHERVDAVFTFLQNRVRVCSFPARLWSGLLTFSFIRLQSRILWKSPPILPGRLLPPSRLL
jgi:hypothetical protein